MVQIAILIDDAALGRRVTTELEDAGLSATINIHRADIAIVDGRLPDFERRVQAAMAESSRLEVVALVAPRQLNSLPDEVRDFVIMPAPDGAIAARISLFAREHGIGDAHRRALLAMAIEAAGDIVEITDPRARISYVNPAFTATLGYTAEEALGKTPGQLMRSAMHSPAFFKDIDRTLSAGLVWKGLLISKAKDGRLVHLETTIAPVMDRARRVTHHIAVKRDITDRLAWEARLKATNEELQQARDVALEANRVKSLFLANMSHELRTPLNAIIGYSEILEEDAIESGSQTVVGDVRRIRSAGRHLLGLINDILDLSKIEAERVDLYFEEVDLTELIGDIIKTIKPLAAERGNRVELTFSLEQKVVRSDETRLRQILFNLLSNANKFTDRGTVRILVGPAADDARYAVEVTDTGIGMSAEQIERLFTPFVQADASTTRKYGGTGLGLTICQRLCEMMGGSIHVSSVEGEGSCFRVELPFREPNAVRIPSPRASLEKMRRVLLIDDDPVVHDLLIRTLGPAGFDLVSAQSGEEGIQRARIELPDLIILDVVMPDLDGWQVLTTLKNDEATQDIPVVMLTILDSRSTGLALGAVDYIVKPVEPSRIVKIVRRHCGSLPANVLIVEDHAPTRDLMRRVITHAGHTVAEAVDGEHGLVMLEASRPDVVILDLMMPKVDGLTFLERVRARDELADIPVVVVTAKTLTREERKRLEGSAQQIIAKGAFSSEELMKAVKRQIKQLLATDVSGD